MPVRRNLRQRRPDADMLAKVWIGILETGFDFFHEAGELGILVNDAGQPDREAASSAWHRYGARVMTARDPSAPPPWGLEQFGPPGDADAGVAAT